MPNAAINLWDKFAKFADLGSPRVIAETGNCQLKLVKLLGKEVSKQQQSSDWGAPELSDAQKEYAATDVRHLHAMHAILVERLAREKRTGLAQACFDFLPARARLDLAGWPDHDIFSHESA